MSPLPVSRSTSAPSVGGTLSVTSPEPVSMWRDENVETSATSTAPLPVPNDSSSPLADVTSMSPDPVSTCTFVAFPSRTVTFPDPVSSRSVDPSTPVTVMSPEPVPRLTSPDAVRRSTLPDPVWIRREPRVRSAATSAEATDTRIVPSTFVTNTLPTPRYSPTDLPLGTVTCRSANASSPSRDRPVMRTSCPSPDQPRWCRPPSSQPLSSPNVPSSRTCIVVFQPRPQSGIRITSSG